YRPSALSFPMRIAYLDCFSGMSGDMFLGALIDAGVPAKLFEETVAGLNLGAELKVSRVTRAGISAVKVDGLVNGEKEVPREEFEKLRSGVGPLTSDFARPEHHSHDHSHSHPELAQTDHNAHEHAHARGLAEIKEIISGSTISTAAKKTATAIF